MQEWLNEYPSQNSQLKRLQENRSQTDKKEYTRNSKWFDAIWCSKIGVLQKVNKRVPIPFSYMSNRKFPDGERNFYAEVIREYRIFGYVLFSHQAGSNFIGGAPKDMTPLSFLETTVADFSKQGVPKNRMRAVAGISISQEVKIPVAGFDSMQGFYLID